MDAFDAWQAKKGYGPTVQMHGEEVPVTPELRAEVFAALGLCKTTEEARSLTILLRRIDRLLAVGSL